MKHNPPKLRLLAAIAVALLGTASTASAALMIDFDANSTVQSGFDAFTRSPGTNASPTFVDYTNTIGTSNQVRVEISASSNLQFRDRTPVTTTSLADLATDFVFGDGYADVDVTLSTLKPQVYQVTTYHHDSVSNILTPAPITVSDAFATGDIRADGFNETAGTTPGAIRQATFELAADGTNPVTFSTGMINGFEIAPLEPLSVTIGRTDLDPVSGFREFANSDDNSATQTRSYIMQDTGGSFVGVDVTVAAGSSHLEFRAARSGSVTGLRDSLAFVSSSGDTLDTTLGGLPAGLYEIQTWHNDPNGALQSENTPYSLSVTDALGTRTATGLSPVTSAQLTGFRSSGGDVTLSTQSSGRAMINGFRLVPIAEQLNVTIGAPNLDSVDGFRELASNTATTASGTYIMPIPQIGEFPTVTVGLSTTGSNLQFRDNRSGSVEGLLDSLVFVSTPGSDLILTLDGLLAGPYEILTYHDDPNTALRPENTDFSITVSDALGARTTSGLAYSALGELTHFYADGSNPVTFTFNAGAGNRAMLNGFELNFVPEPSTLAMLLGLAGLGLAGYLRRRKTA